MYIAAKAFLTTSQVELVRNKLFAVTALNPENMIFVVYVISLAISDKVYFFRRAQIVLLKVDEALITVSSKYSNSSDIFFAELAKELSEHTKFNNHVINFVDGK